ncbi:hypothetical protein [Bacillus sp. V2I10]|uniref:hypothetical protein n=1 Tax=Bacillus sp. V2I10 TaxID=3042276 RepID=UPI002789E894|nr:hypothetical protein [Bacillus sp. V2I10]MDQ0859016.1 beta-phosphoglucomutase-like phosphatase (HAD superfamily) [Bacillus sp. V2I10]
MPARCFGTPSFIYACMVALFDVIITGDDVEKPKTHPEGVKKALFILGAENNEARQ